MFIGMHMHLPFFQDMDPVPNLTKVCSNKFYTIFPLNNRNKILETHSCCNIVHITIIVYLYNNIAQYIIVIIKQFWGQFVCIHK